MEYTALDIIKNEYGNSTNMMTPEILGFGLLPFGAYELACGKGIYGEKIYGVSVVRVISSDPLETERERELSQLFHSRISADNHIEELKKMR